MSKLVIYHNPRCVKSRQALALLQERRVPLEVVEYLKQPLSLEELKALRQKLGMPASQWVRKKEKEFALAGLSANSTDEEILAAMARYPILMERPIVVRGKKAVLGRPPERVLELVE
ncbi:MAG: arsenate reductase (glutaredoxin) [Candidatus Binatia bacterium]|nr:arsenate reductase (glutaredoxin) [Candidatus Binatia bacterium]